MFRIIVAGSRSFDDYGFLRSKLLFLLKNKIRSDVEIVSGGARGADCLGERFAKEHNLYLRIFKADWNRYGKSAGPIRNKEMGEYADALVAFWDYKSVGTKHMIDFAKEKGLDVRIINIERV